MSLKWAQPYSKFTTFPMSSKHTGSMLPQMQSDLHHLGETIVPIITRERRRRGMTFLASSRRRLQHLTPYLSLAILLTPLLFVEPLKVVALFVAGKGHWLAGCAMLLGAYGVSLFFIERLYELHPVRLTPA
jgi:hypothetical protein